MEFTGGGGAVDVPANVDDRVDNGRTEGEMNGVT